VNAAILRDLLVELLGHRSHLQGQLLTAGEWRSQILAATKEQGQGKETVLRPTYMTWLITTHESTLRRSLDLDFATDRLTGIRKYSFRVQKAKQLHAPPRRPKGVDGETACALEAA